MGNNALRVIPKPSGIVLAGAVVLVLPCVLFVFACVVLLLLPLPEPGAQVLPIQIHEAAIIVASICAVLATLTVLAEWRAMAGRSLGATTWIFRIFAYLTVLTSLGLIQAALGVIGAVTGMVPKADVWIAWSEFALQLAIYSWCGFIAFGHLRWWHVLNRCKMAQRNPGSPGIVGDPP